MKTKMLGLALAAAFAASAHGAAVTFDFVSSLLSTQPDRTIAFSGTVTNTGPAAAFLNADEFTFPLPLNDTPFFLNFPLSLAPGTSVTATLFMVTVPAGTPVGLYVGTFSILGGDNAAADDLLAARTFGVQVVPEPGAMGLVLLAFAGALLVRRVRPELLA